MPGKVVVVGSVNADLGLVLERFPSPGETLHARGGSLTAGGKGANQALAARLEGADVTMLGAVGDAAAAGPALALLRRWGVDLDQVLVVPGPTGLAVVMVDAAGENQIVLVAGANAALGADAVVARGSTVASADVVVLQGEIPVDGIEAAALATGRVVLNLAPVVGVAPDVVRRADPLVVNQSEGAQALRLLDPDARVPDDEADLAAELEAHGCPSVVVTVGARGAIVHRGGTTTAVPSESVEVVDTTGAGDAFVGVLAARLAHGDDLVSAARRAAAVAAGTVTRAGAQASYVARP